MHLRWQDSNCVNYSEHKMQVDAVVYVCLYTFNMATHSSSPVIPLSALTFQILNIEQRETLGSINLANNITKNQIVTRSNNIILIYCRTNVHSVTATFNKQQLMISQTNYCLNDWPNLKSVFFNLCFSGQIKLRSNTFLFVVNN